MACDAFFRNPQSLCLQEICALFSTSAAKFLASFTTLPYHYWQQTKLFEKSDTIISYEHPRAGTRTLATEQRQALQDGQGVERQLQDQRNDRV